MASQAYFAADGIGDWYECLATTAFGESPASRPDLWQKLEIPVWFEPFLVSRALSLVLIDEGQNDKARAEAQIAEAMLQEIVYRDRAERGRLSKPRVFAR
jgi:hypothetical protein